ncbi:DUF817 family protein [Acinetobacter larvae]|uniref:DUF817 domain-containing protein n=1 Tax=Acinetobacter larvae TaxID=1789224 RepID=A0A1B2M0S2_9GAMM|nr:DUF817 family protein [Acinetobacter larvae]AOA58804.1 hypothetical protein BFG52_10895 [Acinetobacter larvae]
MHMISDLFHLLYKAASSALFGILLLLAFMVTAPIGSDAHWGLYRYDLLLIYALVIQSVLLLCKLESWKEAKVIAIFHVLAMIMEVFLTHPEIASWQYPEPVVFKIYTVPLFAGFMYSAVGSFFARALKIFQVKICALPPFSWMIILSVISYLNFMTKFFIWDARYILFLSSILLFHKTQVYMTLKQRQIKIPMLVLLLIFACVIWIAENISTFFNIWLYPSQLETWHMVSLWKLGSWYLLLLLSFVLVLKVLGHRQGNGDWTLNCKL